MMAGFILIGCFIVHRLDKMVLKVTPTIVSLCCYHYSCGVDSAIL